jgi:hypothetical protein
VVAVHLGESIGCQDIRAIDLCCQFTFCLLRIKNLCKFKSTTKPHFNMFAVYWPVMAFVAAIVLVLAFLSLSLGKMCGARTEPLPERDLTTYLPEDDDNAAAFNDIADPALNNPEFSMDMGYNQETSY